MSEWQKIKFRYSRPYDIHWYKWTKFNFHSPKKDILEKAELEGFEKQLEKSWVPLEKKVLREISQTLKLNWKEAEIICYVVSNAHGISDPLTIGINNGSLDKIISTLIHELTHRIFVGNEELTRPAWKWVRNTYKNESQLTQTHIICHSLLKHIYLKFFDEERLRLDIEKCQKHEDYKRAWEIVEENNYLEILDSFKSKYACK